MSSMAAALTSLQHCCSFDVCASQLGTFGVRTRLRVGTTCGLRDEPLNAALSQKRYEQMPGASVEWVQMPRDQNAVAAMLVAGLLDLAAIYTEDVMAQVSSGNSDIRICGMFQAAPRRWSCLVPPGQPRDSLTKSSPMVIAMPAGGMGPQLALALLKERLGLSITATVKILYFEDLNTAIRALMRNSRVNAILWEINPMERHKAKDWCDIVEEIVLPWPTHLLVAHKETLFAKLCTIRYFMCFTNLFFQDFQMDATGESAEYFKAAYPELLKSEVDKWVQSSTWTCSTDVDVAALEAPVDLFKRSEILPVKAKLKPSRHLARGVRLRNAAVAPLPVSSVNEVLTTELGIDPALEDACSSVEDEFGEHNEAPSDDEADVPPDREGAASCLPDSKCHNFLRQSGCSPLCESMPAATVRMASVGSAELIKKDSPKGKDFVNVDDEEEDAWPPPAG